MTELEYRNLEKILEGTLILKSNLKVSEWYESKMIAPPDSPFAGKPISYDDTPFWREPVDCQHPDHPARDISIMGHGQGGKTTMVILPTVLYTMDQDPCNIIYLTGHTELSADAMGKLDFGIYACGMQDIIGPTIIKPRNNKSGDTLSKKEFKGYDVKMGSMTNHNLMRQYTAKRTIGDDISAAALSKSNTGDTIAKFKTRTKSHEDTCKRLWISTPQRKGSCMIEKQINKSDKRLWMIQCPHCMNRSGDDRIDLRMPFEIEGTKEMAGLTWKLDNLGNVDRKSVGYICQRCSGFFTDQNKFEMLLSGIWVPTQTWLEPYHYGYKINGLYNPVGMTSWYTMACKWVEINPDGQPRKERDWQTFINDDVGDVYEEPTDAPSATELMKKMRDYKIGVVPEAVSEADGNEDILLLTFAADCNGKPDDARIDYEIRAWSRAGATYSVEFGSLGTFIPNQTHEEKAKTVREKWSYEKDVPNSVWKLVDQKLGAIYKTDTGREMNIFFSGLDCGYLDTHVFNYIDKSQYHVVGLMGDKEVELIRYTPNMPVFKQAKSRKNLYMLNVNMIKDDVSNIMSLQWRKGKDLTQPHQFMNLPQYDYDKFFKHFESESRRTNEKGYFGWLKKNANAQNHQWDVCVYQYAVKDILLWLIFKQGLKRESWSWVDYANGVPPRKK